MNNQIKTFIEFLLDTETTSEVSFNQSILKKAELYHVRYQSFLKTTVDQKLQEWKNFYQKKRCAIADRIALNAGDEVSDTESEEDSSSENEEEKISHSQLHRKHQTLQRIKH